MKTIIGIIILNLVFGLVFGATVYVMGFKKALMAWALFILLTTLLIVGLNLVFKS